MEKITTYKPDNALRNGIWGGIKDIVKEILDNRWLTWQLFRRDFVTLYKQSLLGIFWVFILPLVTVGTFILLNQSGILSIGTLSLPYPVFALFGISLWQLFSTGLLSGANSLVRAGELLVKINFSRKSLVLASLGQSIVSFLFQFGLLILLIIIYKVPISVNAIYLPLMVLPLMLLTTGLALVLALLNGVIRDVGAVLPMGINFLLLLTPILYKTPESGWLSTLTAYNPLYYLLVEPRNIFFTGEMIHPQYYFVSVGISLLVFVCATFAFHITEARIAERV